jgi:uncharacterized protein involved in response to NO
VVEPAWRGVSITAAGTLWVIAFLLFLAEHGRSLARRPVSAPGRSSVRLR